ncbi:cytochrome b/b6 domain-containing protein [soil metagenome]
MQTNAIKSSNMFYRHRLPVRIMHWTNVISFFLLLMSGLTIFNAHPNLYWGEGSHFDTPLLSIGAANGADGKLKGVTRVFGHEFDTTGVLGASMVLDDKNASSRAFPAWASIPSRQWLSMARHWHLFFAWVFVLNGLAYIFYAAFSGHLRRNLLPTFEELRRIPASIKDHLMFRHPTGEAAKRYNVLQILAYLTVIFVLLPLIVIAGLGMSPRINAMFDGWVGLLGGRQSARTLHFLAAFALLAFVAIHVFEVIVTGLWNNLRSMITGQYRLPQEKPGISKDQQS